MKTLSGPRIFIDKTRKDLNYCPFLETERMYDQDFQFTTIITSTTITE